MDRIKESPIIANQNPRYRAALPCILWIFLMYAHLAERAAAALLSSADGAGAEIGGVELDINARFERALESRDIVLACVSGRSMDLPTSSSPPHPHRQKGPGRTAAPARRTSPSSSELDHLLINNFALLGVSPPPAPHLPPERRTCKSCTQGRTRYSVPKARHGPRKHTRVSFRRSSWFVFLADDQYGRQVNGDSRRKDGSQYGWSGSFGALGMKRGQGP
ncbi:hypothetical protein FIBSPDRAFT_263309 [Athelia psychrophila]|uniref:Uncharacterized protein n=1 Tax=Athelia psychrophila TaxID=1759441 RepID=A0A165XBC7_9AGAM|nr:hypothetical protein FIBSPDRAFT_263309 [Fibularhizoctonia sp. CBS 109695]